MPYISKKSREAFDDTLCDLPTAMTVGELTYVLTRVCDQYLETHGVNFTVMSAVVSALECSKLELYRRIVAGYEDNKRIEHGDVYNVIAGDTDVGSDTEVGRRHTDRG